MSRIHSILTLVCVGLAVLADHSVATAQLANVGPSYRLYVVPQVGVGTDFDAAGVENPLTDAWTLGAQLELVNGSRWTPLLAYQQWYVDRVCGTDPTCATRGWSVEGGMMHSFHPRSILRPYGGAVLGYRRLGDAGTYLQGRVGIDLTPFRSPVTFRIEARYHEPITHHADISRLVLLNTGIRFTLPDR